MQNTLTERDRNNIHIAMLKRSKKSFNEEDRDPEQVIADDYDGDHDSYLEAMARYLGVPLESDQEQEEPDSPALREDKNRSK